MRAAVCGFDVLAFACVHVCDLHLSDGFGQVGGYFRQPLPSAVHYVVAAGARLWTLQHAAGGGGGRLVTYGGTKF